MAEKHKITTTPSAFSAERQLTLKEIKLAQQVYGNNIAYDQVKVGGKQWPSPLSEDFTAGNAYQMWVFMFEMAQVWLDQDAKNHQTSAPAMPIWDALSSWLRDNPRAGYNHNLDLAKRLLAYAAEQRADSACDYYILKYKRGALTKDERLALYDHMLAESHPHFAHDAPSGQARGDEHDDTHHLHEQNSEITTTGLGAAALGPSVVALGSTATLGSGTAALGPSAVAVGSATTLGSDTAALGVNAVALGTGSTLGSGASALGLNALATGSNPAVGAGIVGLGLSAAMPNKANAPKDAFPMAELPEAEKRSYLPRDIWLKNGFVPSDVENGRWLWLKDSKNQDQAVYMYSSKSVVAVKPEDQRCPVDVAQEVYLKMAEEQLKETSILKQRREPSNTGLSPDR